MFQCCVKVRFQRSTIAPLKILSCHKMSTIDSTVKNEETKVRQEKKGLFNVMKRMRVDQDFNVSQKKQRAHPLKRRNSVLEINSNNRDNDINLFVLGSGAIGTSKSLCLHICNKSYLFNCGESCHRLAHQERLKLLRLQDIFVTQSVWENIGGITGLMLMLKNANTVSELNIHGPPGIDSLLNATVNFARIQKLKKPVDNIRKEGTYDDGVMKIKYFPIYANKINSKYTEKYFSKLPEKMQLRLELSGEERSGTVENFGSTEEDYNEYLNEDQILKGGKLKNRKSSTHYEEKISICYVCQLQKKIGKLDLEACVERNVPPGPLFGKLKNKKDITLSDGSVVKWTDVTHPDIPGTTFVIVDCPSVNYIDSLIQNKGINKARAATQPEDKIKLVVHFSPPSVMNHPRYKEWIKGFQDETQHLRLNEDNSCIGTPATYKLQTKLNMIHPTIFPSLAKSAIPIRKKNGEATPPNLLYIEESSSDISEKDKKNKIIIGTTMLTINLNEFKIFRDPNYCLCPEECIEEAFAEKGAQEAFENLKVQVKEIESAINSTTDGDYPKVVFLGTGNSMPTDIRNSSGILVFTSPDACLLLDCGENTYNQIVRLFGRDKTDEIMLKLKAVYVSHFHADHHLGFIGLIKGRRRAIDNFLEKHRDLFKDENLTRSEMVEKLNITPLYLAAPPQILYYLKIYDTDVEHIQEDFSLIPNDVLFFVKPNHVYFKKVGVAPYTNLTESFLLACNLSEFKTCHVQHCFNAYGVALKSYNGYKITYSGDTEFSKHLIEIGLNSDLLIHEATMDNDQVKDAAKTRHSTMSQAVDVGQQMKAKHIVLTHFGRKTSFDILPRFTENLPDNVGIAFDNMIVSMKQLYLLPKFIPVMRLFFADSLRILDNQMNRRFIKEHLSAKQVQEFYEKKNKELRKQLQQMQEWENNNSERQNDDKETKKTRNKII